MENTESISNVAETTTNKMAVEVAYALPERQVIISVELPPGSTAQEAIETSGILDVFPEIDLNKNGVGIFSRKTTLQHVLQDKDRVEIYRPLIADPKEVRRRRAAQGKAMRKGGGDAT